MYVRQRTDPETQMNLVTQTVQSVLDGPTNWLKPVVTSKFPSGTALKSDTKSLALDDRNALKVPLNERASNVGEALCKRMAAQLLFTLRDLTTTRIGQVELDRANGSQLCVLSGDQAETYAPDRMSTSPGQYFVDAGGHVERMRADAGGSDSSGGSTDSSDGSDASVVTEPVPGPLGKGEQQVRTVAVSRDEKRAAGVSADGKSLLVAPLAAGGELARTPVTSDDKDAKDGGLSAPSWDGRGDLWVADRNPAKSRLLRLAQGAGRARDGRRGGSATVRSIEQVRMSADGVRVALLVSEGGPHDAADRPGRAERRRRQERGVGGRTAGRGAADGGRDRRVLGGAQPPGRGRQGVRRGVPAAALCADGRFDLGVRHVAERQQGHGRRGHGRRPDAAGGAFAGGRHRPAAARRELADGRQEGLCARLSRGSRRLWTVVHRGGRGSRALGQWRHAGVVAGVLRPCAADRVRRLRQAAYGAVRGCRAALLGAPARRVRPAPEPAGLPAVYAAAPYEDAVRAVLLGHKERGALGLAGVLGQALAGAVRAVAARRSGQGPLLLVPMPSSRRAVRARGHDAARRMALAAAGELRRTGTDARVVAVLRQRRAVADQAGLSAPQRLANLSGALVVAGGGARLLAGGRVVLVDDLMTTGASLVEAARAVRAAGRRSGNDPSAEMDARGREFQDFPVLGHRSSGQG